MSEQVKSGATSGERLQSSAQPMRRAGDQIIAKLGLALGTVFFVGSPGSACCYGPQSRWGISAA